jgi:hypothetical protein
VVAAGLLAGCGGGGNVGMRVRKPASQRPDVDLAIASKGKLVIPGGGAFNLTSFKSGQMGAARGLSEAIGNDGARCRAEARDGGSAWGEYQLGYCFDNVTDVPLDATVRLRLTVTESTSTGEADEEEANSLATATGTLVFFIKDATTGLNVRKESLLSSDLEKGAASTHTPHDLVFDARFESGHGYYLVIAGRAEVKAAAARSVACSLDVARCSLEIAWRDLTTASRGEASESSLSRHEPEVSVATP